MDDSRWPCASADGEHESLLSVSVIPNAKRSERLGLHGDALRVRLAAPAIEGRANEALIAWMADQLGVPRRAVALKSGAASRRKRLQIAVPLAHLLRWLDAG